MVQGDGCILGVAINVDVFGRGSYWLSPRNKAEGNVGLEAPWRRHCLHEGMITILQNHGMNNGCWFGRVFELVMARNREYRVKVGPRS